MKKSEIRVGGIYAAKVSERVVPVRIVSEHPAGGWIGRSMVTDREVRIRSAARLRFEFESQTVDGRTFLARKGSTVLALPEAPAVGPARKRFQVTVTAVVETAGAELMTEDVEGLLLGASAQDIAADIIDSQIEIEEVL